MQLKNSSFQPLSLWSTKGRHLSLIMYAIFKVLYSYSSPIWPFKMFLESSTWVITAKIYSNVLKNLINNPQNFMIGNNRRIAYIPAGTFQWNVQDRHLLYMQIYRWSSLVYPFPFHLCLDSLLRHRIESRSWQIFYRLRNYHPRCKRSVIVRYLKKKIIHSHPVLMPVIGSFF